MSTEAPLYQKGICPDCSSDSEQRLLFATDEWSGPLIEHGQIVAYERIETLSLFTCQRCQGTLFYSTQPQLTWPVSVDEESDVYWIVKLTSAEFLEDSTLLWPIRREALPSSVPQNVRKIYEEALKVKGSSPDSFSVQIRRAIQATCINKGAKEYDNDGRRLDLVDHLRDLSKSGVFPRHVSDVLNQLRYLGNTAAHSIDSTVKPEIANIADELFRLLIQYIYEIPDKLAKLKQETQTLRFEDEKKRDQGP